MSDDARMEKLRRLRRRLDALKGRLAGDEAQMRSVLADLSAIHGTEDPTKIKRALHKMLAERNRLAAALEKGRIELERIVSEAEGDFHD